MTAGWHARSGAPGRDGRLLSAPHATDGKPREGWGGAQRPPPEGWMVRIQGSPGLSSSQIRPRENKKDGRGRPRGGGAAGGGEEERTAVTRVHVPLRILIKL